MKLLQVTELYAGGLGSGCNPEAGHCGRPSTGGTQKLTVAPEAPGKEKPIALVFGGSFNPPHLGHVQAAERAERLLTDAGYTVGKVIVAPTADKLIKNKLGERTYPLDERTELSKRTFPKDMIVTSGPGKEAEAEQGKLRRTQLADWAQKRFPNYTVVNVTGEDAAPGHPPAYPSLYAGDKGSNHEGYYYLAVPRPAGSLSSTEIRNSLREGRQPEGMTTEALSYLKNMFKQHPEIKAGGPGSGCNPKAGKCGRPETGTDEDKFHALKRQWAVTNNKLLNYVDKPDSPEAQAGMRKMREISKQMNALKADTGAFKDVGLPGGPKDIVVVGAGPGGLASAIMGATDGLDTMVIDAQAQVGGQAKFSSRIENFPGFPIGVTGKQLAETMYKQATRLGAQTKLGVRVVGLEYDPKTDLKTLTLSNGEKVQARSVILAGGVEFRKLEFPGADAKNIIYANAEMLAKVAKGGPAVVLGGSNGAAQAALGVSRSASHVYLISRSPITKGMSDYQVQALQHNPKITVLEGDEIAKMWQGEHGNSVVETKNGKKLEAKGVGVFIGGAPNTDWLPSEIKRENGKIAVNNELETNIPGVYAIGDNRAGSIGRIGAAVGDGQMAEHSVFSYFDRVKQKENTVQGASSNPRQEFADLLDELFDLDKQYPYLHQTIEKLGSIKAGGSGSGCHGPNCGRPRKGGRVEPHGPHIKNMGMKKIKSSKISDFVYKFIKKNGGKYDLGKCTDDDYLPGSDTLEASGGCGQLYALYRAVGLKTTDAVHLNDAIREWTVAPTKKFGNAAQKVVRGKIGGDKLAKALAIENGIARARLKDKDITLYRGIDDKYAINILNQALRNGHNNFTIKTRGADSWTDDPSEAEGFGPIMLKTKVPAKYVMSSHRSNDVLRDMDENEFIVAFPKGKVKITSKNVAYKGDFYAASATEEEPIEIDLTNDNWLRNKRKKRIKAGGQGSGCHGDNCGRPPGKDALGKNEHVVRYYGMNRRRLADGNVGYEKLLNPSKMVRVEFSGGSNWHVLIGKKEGPNWNWKVTGKGSDYYDLRSTLDQTFKERESPPQQERQLNYPKMQESLKKHKAKLEDDAKYEEIVKKPWSKQTDEERRYVAQHNRNQLKLPLDAVGFDMVQLKRPKMPKLGHKPNPSEGHGSFGKSGHFKTSPTKLRADAGVRFPNPHGPITFKNPHGPVTFKNPHGAFKVPGSHGGYKIPNPSESGSSGKMGHNNPNPSLKADAEGEPMVGNMGHAHIEPITWFQPPSGKLKKPIPADDPTNRDDDEYLDVTKRKARSTQNQRMNILKTQVPGGNPPMIPVRTTAMEPQSGVYQPLYASKKRIKTRPAKIMGAKATRIYLPR